MRVTFQCYPYTKSVEFTCSACGRARRKRTFTHECTLNPFNKTASTPEEVRAQSKAHALADAEIFMREPVCRTCENNMSYREQNDLRARRRASDGLATD